MMSMLMATYGTAILIAFAFLLVLAICWIILPFALIGTKPLLRQILAEQRRTNELLEQCVPALRRGL